MAIITGAGSGMGRVAARMFAAEDARRTQLARDPTDRFGRPEEIAHGAI